jgi:hypothetical protein
MAKRRKTQAERENERAQADRQAWEEFEPRLAGLQTLEDAAQLVAEAPPVDYPGRGYYSNLGFFLQQFTVPNGSNGAERFLYARFIERLDAAGALKPGAAAQILRALVRT